MTQMTHRHSLPNLALHGCDRLLHHLVSDRHCEEPGIEQADCGPASAMREQIDRALR
jgi:hypothetical protein